MTRVHIHWKLRQYLSDHGLTAYKLAQAVPQARQPTIYRLASGKAPQSISFEVLGQVLQGLGRLTGETVQLDDVLDVVETEDEAVQAGPADDLGLTWPLKKFRPRPPLPAPKQPTDTLAILDELRGPKY